MTPAISVVVPVYRVEQFLRRAIESVINQNFTDWELILVDDGSPDTCGAICDEYAKNDRRIHVIHKENGGLSSARNAGMKIAAGEFVYFLDSDDYIPSQALQALYERAKEYEADIVMAGHDRIAPGGRIYHDYEDWGASADTQAIRRGVILNELPNFAWGKLYRRSLWDDLWFPEGVLVEDLFSVAKTFYRAKKILLIPDALYFYSHENVGSIMNGLGTGYIRIRYGRFLGWREHERLAQKEEPEAVAVCSENAIHAAIRAISLNAGKNVLQNEEITEIYNYLIERKSNALKIGDRLVRYLAVHQMQTPLRWIGAAERALAERQQRRRCQKIYGKEEGQNE